MARASWPCAEPERRSEAVAPRRILLVEDNVDILEAMRELLEEMGHLVEVSSDGVEGANRLLELRPDVALVDIGLPGIDGYEVARRVRSAPGGDDFYLIALTGYGGSETKAKVLAAGFDVHMVKPLSLSDLPRLVEQSRPAR
ncbi:response regulator [Pyxidicoccus fallax]|uniref:Response regulator n=2 Tax=Pyxidicoccus fallax TaxID=394095 RepID=A0A848LZJ7_9BACT|nr:response regulator [Pyxidicoccus fallax]NPC85838.1 response regulator [Pyxidicoccus fallax]